MEKQFFPYPTTRRPSPPISNNEGDRTNGFSAFAGVWIFCLIISICIRLCVAIRTYKRMKMERRRRRIVVVAGRTTPEERLAHRHVPRDGSSDAYINSTFIEDLESTDRDVGIFPSAPPPYAPLEAPPKYEDIIKEEENNMRSVSVQTRINVHTRTTPAQSPPPYTIST
ncbi:uncharacterized protein LOC130895667 isoform X2 [Diorhabda carinulata]|uniref:uncharacterized protein LOC130895667 isoform X2 n=1 Tax=Diorhabda carinulata TaxID=1163345 RepID=UPI0025A0602D|nr:uncharacterized protein LOC130895667 isoform X2 [Diorhabda carinulata]